MPACSKYVCKKFPLVLWWINDVNDQDTYSKEIFSNSELFEGILGVFFNTKCG